jgi:hypothetical protein
MGAVFGPQELMAEVPQLAAQLDLGQVGGPGSGAGGGRRALRYRIIGPNGTGDILIPPGGSGSAAGGPLAQAR